MADALLTSLCSICHVGKPQYRCPRCNIRTCSLPCVTKHKSWSQCSGSRDPTAYVPRSQLRTPAGVDHDYNFLHGIELAAERAERVLVGERGVVQAEELRPLTAQEVRWQTGRDGRRKKVVVTRVIREAKERVVERHLVTRLGRLNIEMVCAPMGMSRQRENHTTLNRRTGRINWQVEWFSWEGDGEREATRPARVLSKVMDDVPLWRAYHGVLEEQDRAQGRVVRRAAVRPVSQSCADGTWQCTFGTMQDPASAKWVVVQGTAAVDVWPEERESAQHRAFEFYLAGRRARPDQDGQDGQAAEAATVVARLDPGECLRESLADTRVLEFPTIFVLRSGEALPAGFVLGGKDSIPAREKTSRGPGVKREGEGEGLDKSGGRAAKRRRGEEGKEEKEDGEEGELQEEDVIAEQEMGNEEEEEEDDDMTSSSGSDSED